MRQFLSVGLMIVSLPLLAQTPAFATAKPRPILGTWQLVGTTPPGFVRQGAQVARIIVTEQKGKLHAEVLTGKHHYSASMQYAAAHRELQLAVTTVKGKVRLAATVSAGNKRMTGTWYDAHGDDGGFVLLRVSAKH